MDTNIHSMMLGFGILLPSRKIWKDQVQSYSLNGSALKSKYISCHRRKNMCRLGMLWYYANSTLKAKRNFYSDLQFFLLIGKSCFCLQDCSKNNMCLRKITTCSEMRVNRNMILSSNSSQDYLCHSQAVLVFCQNRTKFMKRMTCLPAHYCPIQLFS